MLALNSLPLANAPVWRNRPAVVSASGVWSWGQLHSAAAGLAGQLDPDSTVCNLCSGRVGFLIGWFAALRRGCRQVLPPSGGATDLLALLDATSKAVVLFDDARALPSGLPARVFCIAVDARREGAPAPSWSPDGEQLIVRLYTSGSTGSPEPQDKTLSQLALGAAMLGRRLDAELGGQPGVLQGLVCSVPPQHMFGLEASVMLTLVHGLACLDERPLLPAAVVTAFASLPGQWGWITTPLHLRALVRTGDALPNCGMALASTMPLAQGVAEQAEHLLSAPVLEIYGSTETGAVALRRTAREPLWRALPGVTLTSVPEGTQARGTHFPSPQRLADQIEPVEADTFRLLGRQADLIKIAGRRASLAGLNLLLQDLPGLDDGILHLPGTGEPTQRLVLIYAGAPLNRSMALNWLRKRIDAAFVPRAFIHVDQLPRVGPGKPARAALDAIYTDWIAR